MKCRHCMAPLSLQMVDLATSPPSNAYLNGHALSRPEVYLPLRVLVCEQCWLAQTEDFTTADALFDADYAYFSSVSATWRSHCEQYVQDMMARFKLDSASVMVEVAANDGCLLSFAQAKGIPCYGIEPTSSTAAAARDKGIEIVEAFFDHELAAGLAEQGRQADLIAANNVLAHVPDINSFVSGFARLLKPEGVATFEFPHLAELIEHTQFDTIYHEHFSYLSLLAADAILAGNGLTIFDVERLDTHGGSLRIFAQCSETGTHAKSKCVDEVIADERAAGLDHAGAYRDFQTATNRLKDDFLQFLLDAKSAGKKIVAYGAAAKGNTLLNYAGIHRDLISYVVDRAEAKQGKYLPGSRIPIVAEDRLRTDRPDLIVILPWNIASEIIEQLGYVRDWGGRFVCAVPRLEIS